jgi:chromosome segregation ATPase
MKEGTPVGRKVEKATEKLARATDQVSEWEGKRQRLEEELASAEQSVGDAAFISGDVEGTAARIASFRTQVAVAHSTVKAAMAAQDTARRKLQLAEASELHAKADKLEKEGAKHQAKTDELLAALKEHEGGPYEPVQPEIGVASNLRSWTPISDRYHIEAQNMRRRAYELESQAQEDAATAPVAAMEGAEA